jgi:23S rRNA (guanosine2251-2'-O)-methyltransferase
MAEYIYGIHPVEELLASKNRAIGKIWIQKGLKSRRIQQIVATAKKSSLEICFEEKKAMDHLIHGAGHQGVVARCVGKTTLSLDDLLEIPSRSGEDPFFIILDQVEDPGNLGAVIRTAAAAGVHGVILPHRGSAPLGGVAYKRSAGALDRVPVARVTNLVRCIEALKERGVWVFGAHSSGGTDYTDQDLSGPVALVVGGEKGLRRLVAETCDAMVSIPMKDGSESLNLSVAAALLIYEVLRQRKKGG